MKTYHANQSKWFNYRVKRLSEYAFLTHDELFQNPLHRLYFDEALCMWDIDAVVKYSLHYQVSVMFFLIFYIAFQLIFIFIFKDVSRAFEAIRY